MRFSCKIREVGTGQLVAAVVRPVQQSDKALWSRWHSHMPHDAEDAHWDWDDLIDLSLAIPDRFVGLALEANSDLQGLRLLEVTDGPGASDVQNYGTHAMRLSTAPWNRPPGPRFRGVGSVLVAAAVLQSLQDGHAGKVHCESLPNAEHFHRQNGMVEFGAPVGTMKRFRFEARSGLSFLRRVGARAHLPSGLIPP